jgi:hypothetical protein
MFAKSWALAHKKAYSKFLMLLDGYSTKNDDAMLPTKALAPLEISSAIVRDLLVA